MNFSMGDRKSISIVCMTMFSALIISLGFGFEDANCPLYFPNCKLRAPDGNNYSTEIPILRLVV